MAVLDTIYLLLAAVTGSYVSPVLTVILVQSIIPLTALFSQCFHPNGRCYHTICGEEVVDDPEHPSNRNAPISHVHRTSLSHDAHGDLIVGDDEQDEFTPIYVSNQCGGLSTEHILGSFIIFLAVLLGLCPAVFSFVYPSAFVDGDNAIDSRVALNTILFAGNCVFAAASQLYKEHTLLQYKQPVDPVYLNLVLSIFQFVFIMVVSPLVFNLQGLGAGSGWFNIYPSSDIKSNFSAGFKCLFGMLPPEEASTAFPEPASCGLRESLGTLVLHVLSIITVGLAVDNTVKAGSTKIMYRGISAGIILAVMAMNLYAAGDLNLDHGPVVNSMHLACTIMLILGSEVYHRVALQDSTFETVYPEMENLYGD
eukprot:CAMPEP_0118725718 /NCGR_PEP_ID=MMETSP0800-20121206/33296_1 /TAXON_ID=210618 ORGANISM="Striatella unipunctata, Strain CCMP2910" /NCGR_SAMPLE_ID=MMETSP0800 /ASSEMBLY_ACC=CAM_ASM_000638 /LENGTH=366 /DNA_ID=CAMNT_0006634449 /DNA_START=382 /DNA_END=1482 /DNA_ORIENTATION=-